MKPPKASPEQIKKMTDLMGAASYEEWLNNRRRVILMPSGFIYKDPEDSNWSKPIVEADQ